MTGLNMFDKVMLLLGYSGANGEISGKDELLTRGLAAINQIYSDLLYIGGNDDFVPLLDINDEINLPPKALYDVMPYGVAMFLAAAEGDGDNQQIFAESYNKKRVGVKGKVCHIIDTLPRVCD